MKYQIPQDKLDKLVFRYLDMYYGDLEIQKSKFYEGNVYMKKGQGIMALGDGKVFYMHLKIVRELSKTFSIREAVAQGIIERWAKSRLDPDITYSEVRIR